MNPKDIETRFCKTPNCPNAATATRGRYAYLCDHCRESAVRRAIADAPPKPEPSATPPASSSAASFEAKAKRLVSVGRKLDQAVAKYKPAKSTLEQAMREWKAEVRALAGEEAA